MELLDIQKIKTKYQIEYYQIIDSTHTYAKRIAQNSSKQEKLIIAEKQTEGIGTKGRKWYTGIGKNIAMTLLIYPNCKVKKLEGITIKIAQAIKQSIWSLYRYELTIKLPNDLLLNNKKICGILTEVRSHAENTNYLLISVGFNVNEEYFSDETEFIATSLKKEYNKHFNREEIITMILENIEKEIEL